MSKKDKENYKEKVRKNYWFCLYSNKYEVIRFKIKSTLIDGFLNKKESFLRNITVVD